MALNQHTIELLDRLELPENYWQFIVDHYPDYDHADEILHSDLISCIASEDEEKQPEDEPSFSFLGDMSQKERELYSKLFDLELFVEAFNRRSEATTAIYKAKMTLKEAGYVGVECLYSSEDIKKRVIKLGFLKCTDEDVFKISESINEIFDKNVGINWSVIDNAIAVYFEIVK